MNEWVLVAQWLDYNINKKKVVVVLCTCTSLGLSIYRNDIEHLYNAFMYSPVSLISGTYPVPAMHSLLVTSDVRNI